MPATKPPEFRRRAVWITRQGEQPVAKIAKELGSSESCLRWWMDVDDVDAGHKDATTSPERIELVGMRRRDRVLEMEMETGKRASAYIAQGNIFTV